MILIGNIDMISGRQSFTDKRVEKDLIKIWWINGGERPEFTETDFPIQTIQKMNSSNSISERIDGVIEIKTKLL